MSSSPQLTGPAARRERGRLEMQASIIDVAQRIVAADGVDGLTIRGVAKALGYSPGALYEYFDSKEAILNRLYFEGTDSLGGASARALADLPADASTMTALQTLGRAYRAFALDHADLYQLVFSGTYGPKDAPEADDPGDHEGGFGSLVRVVRRGRDDGTFRLDIPEMAIVFAAWAAVHGFVSLELGGMITGADQPAIPVDPATDARAARDALFETVLDMALFGFVRAESRDS